MISFWEDLETQATAQIAAGVPSATVGSVPYLTKEPPTIMDKPVIDVMRGIRRRVGQVTQFGCTRVIWDATFFVLLRCRLGVNEGDARFGSGNAFNIVDQVLASIVGQALPGLTTCSTITPVLPDTEEIFEINDTSYEILMGFTIRVQTQYSAP